MDKTSKPLTPQDKARLSKDRKTYFVAAVLVAPLPEQVRLRGPDGAALVLTLPAPKRGQCPP